MRSDSIREWGITQFPAESVKNGVCVLSGYGVKISVEGQHLVCSDGIADERREVRLSRATCGLKRLVIIGHTGFITLDALRWLNKLGAGISAIDTDGNVLMASNASGADYAHLRRSQALARNTPIGIEIIKNLLQAKIESQESVLQSLVPDGSITLTSQIDMLDYATEYDNIRWVEGQAAVIYWKYWKNVLTRFSTADAKRIPEHWRTFGTRSSPITDSPRKAANPANALLNYLYAVLETETVIACRTAGLDPGMGLLHHDQPSRNSLALDIMETVRPQVDNWLFKFLAKQVFRKQDFTEDQDSGCVRISYDMRALLAETSPTWARAIAPWVEYVAQCLNNGKKKLPTHLTQSSRSKGRDGIRKGMPTQPRLKVEVEPVCESCGTTLEGQSAKFCKKCLPQHRREVFDSIATSGIDTLKRARRLGKEPAHGGEAARKRGESQRNRISERQRWERENDNLQEERERFIREIQPRLESVPLSSVMNATGLSIRYSSLIKAGKYVPHPVHYKALEELVSTTS